MCLWQSNLDGESDTGEELCAFDAIGKKDANFGEVAIKKADAGEYDEDDHV